MIERDKKCGAHRKCGERLLLSTVSKAFMKSLENMVYVLRLFGPWQSLRVHTRSWWQGGKHNLTSLGVEIIAAIHPKHMDAVNACFVHIKSVCQRSWRWLASPYGGCTPVSKEAGAGWEIKQNEKLLHKSAATA